ncbi:MAG: hypothetical protein ACRET4_13475 [Steroidobacteraceae bacterium]
MSAASTLFAFVLFANAQTPAPPPPGKATACAGATYRVFDFWVGDWNVIQNGKPAGTNRIERIVGGCALLENWRGVSGSVGNSLSYYDAARRVWHQTWVDNQGTPLELEGDFVDGRMVLTGAARVAASGKTVIDRLTWTPQAGGIVRQQWEMSTDQGKTWNTAFDGRYEKK